MAKLVVITEEMKGRTFELTEDKISVGRLPTNQIPLEDNAVSSHHAELTRKGEDYIIRDLNSTNGTRINGQRVVESKLHHGDVVSFAHLELQYFSSAKGPPQPMPSRKKTLDFHTEPPGSSTVRPTKFGSASPFSKKSKFTRILQMAFLGLGVILILVLVFIVIKVLNL